MDDNEIFFRKQGIRTTIIVNKMLVLIKMISLFFCFVFSKLCYTYLSLLLLCSPLVTSGWLALVNTSHKDLFSVESKNSCSCFSLLFEENVI